MISYNIKLHKDRDIIEVVANKRYFLKKKEVARLRVSNLSKFYDKNIIVITNFEFKETKSAIAILELLENFLKQMISAEFIISTGRFLGSLDKAKINIVKLMNFQDKEKIYKMKYNISANFYHLKKIKFDIGIDHIRYININDFRRLYNTIFEDKITENGSEYLIKKALDSSLYLYDKSREPIGFILLENILGKAYISYIGIIDYMRRKGLGSYLLAKSLEILRNNFSEVFTYVSLDNKVGLSFFEKAGFYIEDTMLRLDKLINSK